MADSFIFVHGLGLSSDIWNRLTPLVKGKSVALDLPGHGSCRAKDYNFDSLWEYVEKSVSPEDWPNSVIVLHSMSAALLPEILESDYKPRAIILIEGNLIGADAEWSRQIVSQTKKNYLSWLDKLRKNSQMVLKFQLKNKHTEQEINLWSSGFKRVDKVALRQIAKNLIKRSELCENVAAIEQLKLPTFFLRGQLSQDWHEGIQVLKKLEVPFIEIPFSAHYPMIDNPEATWKAIELSINLNS